MENEIWKDIPGYEGLYQASNLGRILSLKFAKTRILRLRKNNYGYFLVTLRNCNKSKTFSVHRLVLLAFVGKSDLVVDHINEIKTDNRLCNLEYVTYEENAERYCRKRRVLPKGVSYSKTRKKYLAYYRSNRKQISIGWFTNKEEAGKAAKEARERRDENALL